MGLLSARFFSSRAVFPKVGEVAALFLLHWLYSQYRGMGNLCPDCFEGTSVLNSEVGIWDWTATIYSIITASSLLSTGYIPQG